MSETTKIAVATVGLFVGVLVTSAEAQYLQPLGPIDYVHDFQIFAPVELDFGNVPTGRTDGYFFNYDKTYLGATGEQNAIGDPNVRREVFPVYFDREPPQLNPLSNSPVIVGWPVLQNDLDIDGDGVVDIPAGAPINPDNGEPIPRGIFQTGIQHTVPVTMFEFGDRYEFGWVDDGRGWLFGIMDGPKHDRTYSYGSNAFNGLRTPFGDVYVAFNYQEGLMHGFVDVRIGAVGAGQGVVGITDTDGDGIINGDGFADDIDQDGQFGPDGFDVDTPEGVPDTKFVQNNNLGIIANNIPDYDDLVELPTSFTTLTVSSNVDTDGLELMRMHTFNNRHKMRKHQNNTWELYYGARYLRLSDDFRVAGDGGVLGFSFWDTKIDNNLVGPQVMLRWINEHGRWRTNFQGRFMWGYNISNWEQNGGVGLGVIRGHLNAPLYFNPSTFTHGRQDQDFSPLAEMRLEASYQVSKAFALKLGYTGYFIDNVRRAASHIDYTLPNMGFIDGGTEHIFVNGVTLGFEINH